MRKENRLIIKVYTDMYSFIVRQFYSFLFYNFIIFGEYFEKILIFEFFEIFLTKEKLISNDLAMRCLLLIQKIRYNEVLSLKRLANNSFCHMFYYLFFIFTDLISQKYFHIMYKKRNC